MKKLLLVLLLPLVGVAQYNPSTPSYVVPSGPFTAVGVKVIPSAYNIGQQLHQLAVIPRDITAASCSGAGGWTGSVRLEGSFDNTIFVQMGPAISQALVLNTPSLSSIQGQFPFLRINYVSGNTSQCSLDMWYTGSLSGTPSILPELRYFQNSSGVNTQTILGSCVKGRVTIYNLDVVNGTAANGFLFQVLTGPSLGGSTEVDRFTLPNTFAANASLILPLGYGAYFKAPQNDIDTTFFTMTATNATAYSVRVAFRCE